MQTLDLQPQHLNGLLAVLNRHVPEADVWAYGSRVIGTSHEGSDLDLVLRNPIHLDQPQANIYRLRSALADSNLPMSVEVLDWARLPTAFRAEIERHYILLRPALAAVHGTQ